MLRETPTTPKFKTSFLNSPSTNTSSDVGDCEADLRSVWSNSTTTSENIVKTRLTIPRNMSEYGSRFIEPLRLPRRKNKSQKEQQPPKNSPKTPPPVKPYVHSKAQNGMRFDKSLQGGNCCFCEEPLEYTMAGEGVLSLSCGHVSHFQCLSELMDMGALNPNDNTSGLPICPNCDQLAKPLDGSAYHDMVKSKLLREQPTTPPITKFSQSNYYSSPQSQRTATTTTTATTNTSSNSSSTYASSPESPASSLGECTSYNGGHSKFNDSSPDTLSRSSARRSFSVPFRPPATACTSSPTASAPEVSIVSEVDEIAPSSSREHFAKFLISVTVPNDIFNKNRFSPSWTDSDIKNRVAKRLKYKVRDWRHLKFSQFGKLRLCDKFLVSRDQLSWQDMTCYLFDNILLLVREYEGCGNRSVYIKASIDIKSDLKTVFVSAQLHEKILSVKQEAKGQSLYLYGQDSSTVEKWYACFVDSKIQFPIDETCTINPCSTSHDLSPSTRTSLSMGITTKPPIDVVVAVPICGLPQENKFACIKSTLAKMLGQMGPLDRLGVVIYSNGQSYATPLKRSNWSEWPETIRRIRGIGHGEKNDISEALSSSLKVFECREDVNPVSVLYLLGDSSNVKASRDSFSALVDEFVFRDITVHSFGCTVTHKPDTLVRICSRSQGNYFYVREWKELESCVMGRYMADKSFTHKDVELRLTPKTEVSITSVAGAETSISTDVLEESDGTTPSTPSLKRFNLGSLRKVDLGNMSAGQSKEILVQVALPPKPILLHRSRSEIIDLFDVSLSYKAFKENNEIPAESCIMGTGAITLNLDATMEPPITPLDATIPPSTPSTAGGPSNDFPPSPIYGDIVFANEVFVNAPMFLAVQRHNIHVIRRRIQLAAARNMELALNHIQEGDVNAAYRVLMDSRPLMKGLVEMCSTTNQADNHLYVQTRQMMQILDKDVSRIAQAALKPIAFENDIRKWVIQTICILKNQMAFTTRCDIEAFFLQPHNEVNRV